MNTILSNMAVALKENTLFRRSAVLVWASVATLCIGLYFVSVRADYNDYATVCDGAWEINSGCSTYSIASVEEEALNSWGFSLDQYALYLTSIGVLAPIVYFILGFLIFWRMGITPIGLTVSLALIVTPFGTYASARIWADMHPMLFIPGVFAVILTNIILITFLLVIPNGRFSPSWAKYLWILFAVNLVALILYINSIIILPEPFSTIITIGKVGFILSAIAFQVYRYRYDSTLVERQQTKWIALGVGAYFMSGVIWELTLANALGLEAGGTRLLIIFMAIHVIYMLVAMLPIGITIAMLRYRLWDVDVIIRRTFTYSIVSLILVGSYFLIVLASQGILHTLIGNESSLAVVISTLGVAVLFNPVRYWVQSFIDRLFNRNHYDTVTTLEAFRDNIRDAIDPAAIQGDLIQTIATTIQPNSISFWTIDRPS